MGSQLSQDIRSALLNIEQDYALDWDDIDQTTRQVLAQIGTQRAHEENQRVMGMTYQAGPKATQQASEVEDEHSSSPASSSSSSSSDDDDEDDNDNNDGGGVAPSQQGTPMKTPQKHDGSYFKSTPTKRATPSKRSALTNADKPFVCAFCGARYKHGRSRYRHHKAAHSDLPVPSSSEIPDQEYPQDEGEEDEEI